MKDLKIIAVLLAFVASCAQTSIEEIGCEVLRDSDPKSISLPSSQDAAPLLDPAHYALRLSDVAKGFGGHLKISLPDDRRYGLFFSRIVDLEARSTLGESLEPETLQTTILSCPDNLRQYAVYPSKRGVLALEILPSSEETLMMGIVAVD